MGEALCRVTGTGSICLGPLGPLSTFFFPRASSRILKMGDLISSIAWYVSCCALFQALKHTGRVKRGVSLRHPSKQPLNDADIERIKEIANVELEDARTELERAKVTAQAMDQRNEESDGDDVTGDDEDDSAWVEYVLLLLPRIAH
jgi:hypothetical protein